MRVFTHQLSAILDVPTTFNNYDILLKPYIIYPVLGAEPVLTFEL